VNKEVNIHKNVVITQTLVCAIESDFPRFNVDCSASTGFYDLNEKIGDAEATLDEASSSGRKAQGQGSIL
jgi:hypothetical protein